MVKQRIWTFEWRENDNKTWKRIPRVCDTRDEVIGVATDWLKICAENDFYIQLQLVELERDVDT